MNMEKMKEKFMESEIMNWKIQPKKDGKFVARNSDLSLSNRNPIGKRLKNRIYYERHKKRLREMRIEKTKKRYRENSEYREKRCTTHNYKREQILKEHNNKCDNCSSTENLQLHHTKYIKGNKGIKFVKVLCKECHIKEHYPIETSKNKKWSGKGVGNKASRIPSTVKETHLPPENPKKNKEEN